QVQFPQTITVYAGGSPSSPLIEALVEDASILNKADAVAYADALLTQKQADKVEVEYSTRLKGIRPGLTQTIEVTDRGISSSSFLITEVHADNDEDEQEIVRHVRA